MDKCPVCGISIQTGVRWCPECYTYVLNPEVGRLASPFRRLGAFILDVIILVVVPALLGWGAFLLKILGTFLSGEKTLGIALLDILEVFLLKATFGTVLFLLFLIWYLYELANGRSIGKRILGMQVIYRDGKPANFFVMLIREIIGKFIISPSVFKLGFAWILIDREHQGWHDKLVRTYVKVKS